MSGSKHHYIDPTDKIWGFVSQIVSDEKLVLYDLIRPRKDALRVFIDKNAVDGDKKGSSVTSGECSSVCRRLMHAFVVDGPELGLGSEPNLEVSSPGLERELRLPEHYKAAVGEKVKIVTQERFVSGILEGFSEDMLVLKESEDSPSETLAYSEVKKGQIIYY